MHVNESWILTNWGQIHDGAEAIKIKEKVYIM